MFTPSVFHFHAGYQSASAFDGAFWSCWNGLKLVVQNEAIGSESAAKVDGLPTGGARACTADVLAAHVNCYVAAGSKAASNSVMVQFQGAECGESAVSNRFATG